MRTLTARQASKIWCCVAGNRDNVLVPVRAIATLNRKKPGPPVKEAGPSHGKKRPKRAWAVWTRETKVAMRQNTRAAVASPLLRPRHKPLPPVVGVEPITRMMRMAPRGWVIAGHPVPNRSPSINTADLIAGLSPVMLRLCNRRQARYGVRSVRHRLGSLAAFCERYRFSSAHSLTVKFGSGRWPSHQAMRARSSACDT
jgi:hypothetical protein